MEHTGTFNCSDETLNKIVRNAFWGIRSNYKGMPVDCPQRNERQPWLGDRTMGCWGEVCFSIITPCIPNGRVTFAKRNGKTVVFLM